jgi:hypothetical protein
MDAMMEHSQKCELIYANEVSRFRGGSQIDGSISISDDDEPSDADVDQRLATASSCSSNGFHSAADDSCCGEHPTNSTASETAEEPSSDQHVKTSWLGSIMTGYLPMNIPSIFNSSGMKVDAADKQTVEERLRAENEFLVSQLCKYRDLGSAHFALKEEFELISGELARFKSQAQQRSEADVISQMLFDEIEALLQSERTKSAKFETQLKETKISKLRYLNFIPDETIFNPKEDNIYNLEIRVHKERRSS